MTGSLLGVDVGGTGIKAGAVDAGTSTVLRRRETPTPLGGEPLAIAAAVRGILSEISDDADAPVGICLPTIVVGGVARSAANVSTAWIGTDAVALFQDELQRAVQVLNDADAAGLAEIAALDEQQRAGVVIAITLGTGIGSALFTDGVLTPNTELGHLTMDGELVDRSVGFSAIRRENRAVEVWAERVDRYLRHLQRLFSPSLFVIGGGRQHLLRRDPCAARRRRPDRPRGLRQRRGHRRRGGGRWLVAPTMTGSAHGSAAGYAEGCVSIGGCPNRDGELLTCVEAMTRRRSDFQAARLPRDHPLPRSLSFSPPGALDRVHGTAWGYRRGCRQDSGCPHWGSGRKTCAQARRDYLAEYRARRMDGHGKAVEHGTTRGALSGCTDEARCPRGADGLTCLEARRRSRLAAARRSGVAPRVEPVIADAILPMIRDLRLEGWSIRRIAREAGCGAETVRRLVVAADTGICGVRVRPETFATLVGMQRRRDSACVAQDSHRSMEAMFPSS
ncbi:ROK family protein [Microbacterium sp. ZW T5_45]|uniref:ROK family protein n=1 Tax=Microbacterium sp. ZW T5_45 TaxID=3378080 RepID=UPI0038552EEF